jgi:hypothetical protein
MFIKSQALWRLERKAYDCSNNKDGKFEINWYESYSMLVGITLKVRAGFKIIESQMHINGPFISNKYSTKEIAPLSSKIFFRLRGAELA